ncbi:hypothetical protein [uncultured Empedobacter sp.]|uniref:SLOG domain-containing protein n=1 Tax=uncultured Empedobacter sp. TaxID=410844 RepID=UPI0026003002|nr:hypothetical protein [uncultured Empedobacter sp.]
MVSKELENIFLSASIPLNNRDAKYFGSADVISIRDAVIALTTALVPHYRIIWGGHPSITPLINYVMQKIEKKIQDHFILYQSDFFSDYFPEDNNQFDNIITTERLADKEKSLELMRKEMLSNNFVAGIFIGGMEGVEIEYEMFTKLHPTAITLPIASTGAAAKIIFEKIESKDMDLVSNFAYMSLFQEKIINKLK